MRRGALCAYVGSSPSAAAYSANGDGKSYIRSEIRRCSEIRHHGRLDRATPSLPRPHGGDEIRDEDGQDEQGADHPGLGVPRRVRECESVPKVQDDEDRKDHPGHRPRAAKNTDATEQDHRDDAELEALGGAAANGTKARDEENAGEGGNEAAHRTNLQLHAPDTD